MKTICVSLTFAFMFVFQSCETDRWEGYHLISHNEIEACGNVNPLNNLSWLRGLIIQSWNEPNFIEMIWVKKYKGEDIFVVDYSVSSVMFYYFDCEGKKIDMAGDMSVARTIVGLPSDPDLLYLAEKIKH